MQNKIIFFLIFTFLSLKLFCVDCRSLPLGELRKLNYESSDFIFLGIPITINTNIGEFLVVEEFKGNLEKKIIVNFSNYIDDKDIFTLWLIYGNKNNDTVYVDECSISRSINNTFFFTTEYLPPPMIEEKEYDENTFLTYEYFDHLYKSQCRNDFYDEIELLREISKFEGNLINTDSINIKKEYELENYIIISLLILILFLNILIVFKRK